MIDDSGRGLQKISVNTSHTNALENCELYRENHREKYEISHDAFLSKMFPQERLQIRNEPSLQFNR